MSIQRGFACAIPSQTQSTELESVLCTQVREDAALARLLEPLKKSSATPQSTDLMWMDWTLTFFSMFSTILNWNNDYLLFFITILQLEHYGKETWYIETSR